MAKQIVAKGLKIEEYEFVDTDKNHLFSIKFYPSDYGLIDRGNKFIEWFNSIEIPEENSDEALLKLSDELIVKLDEFLGVKESSDIGALMNPFTLQENGEMYIEVALDNISNLIESELGTRLKKIERRTKKYTDKYTEKYHK